MGRGDLLGLVQAQQRTGMTHVDVTGHQHALHRISQVQQTQRLDKAQQITTAHEVVAKKLNVREAEKLVAKVQGAGRQTPLLRVAQEKSRDVVRLEEELSDFLTAQVEIHVKRKTKRGEQGEITIQFGSLDELNGLIDKLRGPQA